MFGAVRSFSMLFERLLVKVKRNSLSEEKFEGISSCRNLLVNMLRPILCKTRGLRRLPEANEGNRTTGRQ